MTKEQALQYIIDTGVVAIVRLDCSEHLVRVAQAVREGGVKVIEFTLTTPDALEMIREASKILPSDVLLGAGTVLDPESARAAILAGAEFTVSPTLNPAVIEMCRRYSKVCIPGALTPTEILTAWECGADIVKVFPATLGGPQYFKDIAGPLPQIKLIPTGGVSLENAGAFIKAGAVAVAAGSNLVNAKAVKEGRFDAITEAARNYIEAIKAARA
jgi:2-dehydro-3-deoxyphosphogluconate aldolase / (4S)-4-hydroxy-2-oxoglutarate aldolase